MASKGTGIEVKVWKGDTPEEKMANLKKALSKFKKKQKEYGVIKEIKYRQEYIKPSAKRRKVKMDAITREKHQVAKRKELEKNEYIL